MRRWHLMSVYVPGPAAGEPTGLETLGQVRDCLFLVGKRSSWLMVQPTELLKYFGMIGLMFKNPTIRVTSVLKLNHQ